MNDVLSYELERTAKDIHIFLSKLSGKTILITGATGFIGSMLTRLFLVSNMKYGTDINIICSVRNIEKAEALFSNLKNSEQLVYITNGLVACNDSVDYIFHTAAPTTSKFFVTQPVETLNGSISTTLDVLQYATKNRVKKIVYLSSMEQYGIQQVDYQNMTEDDLGYINHLDVRSSYSEGKRICECYCSAYFHEYNVPICIARVAQCFGPGLSLLDNRVSMQFAKSVMHNENIILHTKGQSVSNFCYITDVLSALVVLLFKGESGEAYNICNSDETRCIKDIANLVAKEIAKDKIDVEFDIPNNIDQYGYAHDVKFILNNKKIKSLGWVPKVSMKAGYRNLIDYIKYENSKA